MDELEKSRIEELKKKLYSKTQKIEERHILDLKKHEDEIPRQWEHEEEKKETLDQILNSPTDMVKTDFTKKILQGAFVFFCFLLQWLPLFYLKGSM